MQNLRNDQIWKIGFGGDDRIWKIGLGGLYLNYLKYLEMEILVAMIEFRR